jgi:hypothetical protein
VNARRDWGCPPGSHSDVDWQKVWRESAEHAKVKKHLSHLRETLSVQHREETGPDTYIEFAAPFHIQLYDCLVRGFAQYFRTPVNIWSKAALCVLTSLYISFSFFQASNSIQGLQHQIFNIFKLITIFSNLVPQNMPNFVTQRSLYKVQE